MRNRFHILDSGPKDFLAAKYKTHEHLTPEVRTDTNEEETGGVDVCLFAYTYIYLLAGTIEQQGPQGPPLGLRKVVPVVKTWPL